MDKKKWIIIGCVIILLIGLGTSLYFYLQYRKTDTFHLLQIGYTKEEIKVLQNKDIPLNTILQKEKIPVLKEIVEEKYFIKNKLDRYIAYFENNKEKSAKDIVRMVNVNRDKDYYTDSKIVTGEAPTILVNRYYKLEDNFLPNDLVDISVQFAYANQKIREEVNNAYLQMARKARQDGITLIVSTSFRDYEKQTRLYESAVRQNGEAVADTLTARPGYSEHQTGLALDIFTRGDKNFEETEAYAWLKENCYQYGFIERYPQDSEEITGFSFEPWHYRYVGVDIAQKIKEENITFDEYYAYYIEEQ